MAYDNSGKPVRQGGEGVPQMQNLMQQMYAGSQQGGTQLPGNGTTGMGGGLYQKPYQGEGQQQPQRTATAGPAMYGQPTGWNQMAQYRQQQPQQPMQNTYGITGGGTQLPGNGTTGQPSAGQSPPATSTARYEAGGYGQQPQAYRQPGGNYSMIGQQFNAPRPSGGATAAQPPTELPPAPQPQNMAHLMNSAYRPTGPSQPWTSPTDPRQALMAMNSSFQQNPQLMQQHLAALQRAKQFATSGQQMQAYAYPGMNQNGMGPQAMPYQPVNQGFQQTQYNTPGQATPYR
jgi:hypothetical protein